MRKSRASKFANLGSQLGRVPQDDQFVFAVDGIFASVVRIQKYLE